MPARPNSALDRAISGVCALGQERTAASDAVSSRLSLGLSGLGYFCGVLQAGGRRRLADFIEPGVESNLLNALAVA
jgi:hypothetical protein